MSLAYGDGRCFPCRFRACWRCVQAASEQTGISRSGDAPRGLTCGFCLSLSAEFRHRRAAARRRSRTGYFCPRRPASKATLANAGGIANIGVIVGHDSVFVTDVARQSRGRLNEWLLGEIREGGPTKPIRRVLITHAFIRTIAFGSGGLRPGRHSG